MSNLAQSLNYYGFAFVNENGTIRQGSPNIQVGKNATGTYWLKPVDADGVSHPFIMMAMCTELGPFIIGGNMDATNWTPNGYNIQTMNAGPQPPVAGDISWVVFVYTIGKTLGTAGPA